MAKYKALLTDLDNTLYAYEPCNSKAIEAVVERVSKEAKRSKEEILQMYQKAREEVKETTGKTAASHSRLLYIQRLLEKVEGKTNVQKARQLHELFWETYYQQMMVYPGVKKFFELLRKNKVKIVIVTDLTADIQMQKIKKLGFENDIDFLITSEEAGHDKPHPAIFQLALKKLGLNTGDVVMIGDEQEKDIEGARKAGIEAMLVGEKSFEDGSLKKYFP